MALQFVQKLNKNWGENMAIKRFNPETNTWEKVATKLAKSVQVLDSEGNFEQTNVEDCLVEIKSDINELKKDVKYIYNNGTIGGGGGGGGSRPQITVTSEKTLIVNSDEKITIVYSFTSPNRGNGNLTVSSKGTSETKTIPQGPNQKWEVGPFEKGTHYITFTVEDALGFFSDSETVTVISGSIDISTNFNTDGEFNYGQEVRIPYTITGDGADDLTVVHDLDDGYFREELPGRKDIISYFTIPEGKLNRYGTHDVVIHAFNEKYTSNKLRLKLLVTDGESLYVMSNMNSEFNWVPTEPLIITYRISKRNQKFFKVDYYIDDMNNPVYTDIDGVSGPNNHWNLGILEPNRDYHLKLVVRTLDGSEQQELEFLVHAVLDDFEGVSATTEGLLAHFKVSGQQNSGNSRNKWTPVSGSEKETINATLYDFNYSSNGWQTDTLKFNGKSYAILNYSPFIHGLPESGFTFEITYKVTHTGNPNSKIVSCQNAFAPNQGFYIDVNEAKMQTYNRDQASSQFEQDIEVKKTFVYHTKLDDDGYMMIKIFTDGVISGVKKVLLADFTDFVAKFQYDGKIILGAEGNDMQNEEYSNFSSCEIKHIRLYDRYLSDLEVLTNYIADIQDLETQKQLVKINNIGNVNATSAGLYQININGFNPDNAAINVVYRNLEVEFREPGKPPITKRADISVQGTSSTEYPVKNFQLDFIDNSDGNTKPDYSFTPDADRWLSETGWILKANFMDSSQANSIGAYRFIDDFFRQNNMYPHQMSDSHNAHLLRTTPDGFPCELLANDSPVGLYSLVIDRYADHNYGFVTYNKLENGQYNVERNETAVSYELSMNNGLANSFISSDWNEIRKDFKHRYNYNEKNQSVVETITNPDGTTEQVLIKGSHDELEALVKWMVEVDEDDFVNHLKYHFSVPHLIDYYLICEMLGMIDNMGKNMVLTNYGPEVIDGNTINTKWYPAFYDADSILGLTNDGRLEKRPNFEYIENKSEDDPNYDPNEVNQFEHNNSKLWLWLKKYFYNDIQARYLELRQPKYSNTGQLIRNAVFSYENIISYFEDDLIDNIGQRYYNEDTYKKYLENGDTYTYLCKGNRLNHTKKWIKQRLIFLDSLFETPDYNNDLISFRSNTTSPVAIYIKTNTPIKIKYKYSAQGYMKKTINDLDDNGTEFLIQVNNDNNNEMAITGASYITEIVNINKLDLSKLDIEKAKSLSALNISNNKRLAILSVKNNVFLKELICRDCEKLGSITESSILDLRNSINLLNLDIRNTKIKGIDFPIEGGVLDNLNITKTGIANFSLQNQSYLKVINLTECKDIAAVNVSNCENLTNINLGESDLESFNVSRCPKLNEVLISKSTRLRSITTELCPMLTKLHLKQISSKAVERLDLTTLTSLQELNIESSFIKFIAFGRWVENGNQVKFNSLKKLYANNSSIIAICYAPLGDASGELAKLNEDSILDFNGLSLTNLGLSGCNLLKRVSNLNIDKNVSFSRCTKLTGFTNCNIRPENSISNMFYECYQLTTLPTMNLDRITSARSTFYACPNINMAHVETIFKSYLPVNNKLTDMFEMFLTCSGITGQLPNGLFDRLTKVTNIEKVFSDTGITGLIPYNFFKNMTELRTAYKAFNNTKITGEARDVDLNPYEDVSLSQFLFAYNTKLNNTQNMFANTKLTKPPHENLFRQISLAQNDNNQFTNMYGMFVNCSEMTGEIPLKLLKGLKYLQSIGNLFSGTNLSGEIPENFFNYANCTESRNNVVFHNNNITTIKECFAYSKLSGEIPENLLKYSTKINTVYGLFANQRLLTGSIPGNLFKGLTNLTDVTECFLNCIGLTGEIPENLFNTNKRLAKTYRLFRGNSGLSGSIPRNLFADCYSLTNIAETFYGCSQLSGQIPARISEWIMVDHPDFPGQEDMMIPQENVIEYGLFDRTGELTEVYGLFQDCHKLSGTIPESLLMNASKTSLRSINNLFYRVYPISGSIPEKLFENCHAVEKAEYVFYMCTQLTGKEDIETGETYALPEKLFEKMKKLRSLNRFLYMWQERGTPGEYTTKKMTGSLPEDLFKYNTEMQTMNGMFLSSPVSGNLSTKLFKNMSYLTSVSSMFKDSNIKSMDRDLLDRKYNPKLTNLSEFLKGNGNATGESFNYNNCAATTVNQCFAGCTKLSNYAEIPANYK